MNRKQKEQRIKNAKHFSTKAKTAAKEERRWAAELAALVAIEKVRSDKVRKIMNTPKTFTGEW